MASMPVVDARLLNQAGVVTFDGLVEYSEQNPQKSIGEIVSLPDSAWRLSTKGNTHYGQSDASYWFRVTLTHVSQLSVAPMIRSHYSLIDRLEVFYLQDGALVSRFTAGDSVKFSSWPINDVTILFPVPVLKTESMDVYLKATSQGPIEVPLDLVTQGKFDQDEKSANIWLGMYFGALGIMFVYNLGVYFVVKDRTYLFYLSYVAVTGLLQFVLHGYGLKFFWPDSATLNNLMVLVFSSLLPIVAVAFVREFLQLNTTASRMDNRLSILLMAFFCGVVLSAFALPYVYVLKTIHSMAFICVVFGIYIGIKYWRKGFKPARIFTLGWSVYLISVVVYILDLKGFIVGSPFARYALEIGSAWELALLSLAFGDRINHEKENVSRLLKTMRALAGCSSKVTAAQIALFHLHKMCSRFQFNNVHLYLYQKNNSEVVEYGLWLDGAEQVSPHPVSTKADIIQQLQQIHSVMLQGHCLWIPIGLDKTCLGFVSVDRYKGSSSYLAVDSILIANVMHSLAQTMATIDTEEKERLSMIGSMAAAIVHDLKNPIGAIQGCAVLASKPGQNEADRVTYLNSILSETHRMQVMAQEVLEYSKGDVKLQQKLMPPQRFIEQLSSTLKPMLAIANVEFETKCDLNHGLYIDTDRMHRVMLNLVSNARDAMVNAETVAPRVVIHLTERNNRIVVSVADNGPGIPVSIRANLFEPFVTEGKSEGTGLGMAIVQRIVAAHEGEIRFDTDAQGTVFYISLPMVDVAREANQAELVKQDSVVDIAELRGRCILLAEDNPVNQLVLRKHLESVGVEVVAVDNGQQATDWLAENTPDLLMLDVEMPVMNGLEVARQLRSDRNDSKFPIIGLTGHSGSQEIDACLQAGMDRVLSKPVNQAELVSLMVDLLNRERKAS